MSYRLQLYDDPHSLFCTKVKVVLKAKRVAYEPLAVPCGSTRSPDYLKINPLGRIPALLVQPEGHQEKAYVLVESDAINEWLEEVYPQPRMLPQEPRARALCRALARYHDAYLEPCLRRLYPLVRPAGRDLAAVAAAAAELQQRLEELERLLAYVAAGGEPVPPPPPPLAAYGVGGQLTLADVAYPGVFFYADIILEALGHSLDYGGTPRVQAWRRALDEDEAVAAVMEELRPAGLAWLHSRLGQEA